MKRNKNKNKKLHLEKKDRISEKKEKKFYVEDFLIFIYAFICFVYFLNFQWSMKSLPGPLYGGEIYRTAGTIEHLVNGGNPFEGDIIPDSIPGFLPFYAIVASFFRLFTNDTFKAMFIVSSLIIFASILVYYYLFYKLSKSKKIALFLTTILIPIHLHLSYRNWAEFVLGPLSLLSLILFFENGKIIYFYLSSIILGFISWTHSVRFLSFLIINIVLIINYKRFFSRNNIGKVAYLIYFLLLFFIALPIYYKHLFVYKLQIKENFDKLDFIDLTPWENRIWFLWETIKEFMLRFDNLFSSISSILCILGLFYIFFILQSSYSFKENEKIGLAILITSLLIGFSYFITEPLFKKSLDPYRSFMPLSMMLKGILAIFGIRLINSFLEEKIKKISFHIRSIFFLFIVILLMIYQIKTSEARIMNDRFFKNSKNEISPHYISLQKWIKENTHVNDVFLSTKELIFVINSLTGRKSFIFRYMFTSNPFESFFDREIDAAIILYGNDTNKKIELLKKYNVKYLYWDFYWVNSEYFIINSLNEVSPFDPLMVIEKPHYEALLKQYNISYFKRKWWFEPGTMSDKIRRFNIIYISYENYRNFEKPWKEDLDPFLEEVWNYTDPSSNVVIARLYKIKLPE